MSKEQSPQEISERIHKKIQQLENRQKILLNKIADAERKARTHRLIERGAILESIFPSIQLLTNEEIASFLSAVSRLPEVQSLLPKSAVIAETEQRHGEE